MNTLRQHLRDSLDYKDSILDYDESILDYDEPTLYYLDSMRALFGETLPTFLYQNICKFYVTHPDLTSPVKN